ncbi:MAG: HD domain-containing protein [Proteobacteria bacterium]|nr:HD domain-containing protein [Pseudomonadota bacterium]
MSGSDLIDEHHTRVHREVAAQLATLMDGEKDLPIAKLQSFRKKEEHRLKLWHRAGGEGKEIAARRTELVDILFREIFRHAARTVTGNAELSGLLAAAFGGYGRRELNPFSDVDVSFLHVGPKPTVQMEKIISACLMALWDLGFKVGHATRSVKGAIERANADMVTKTAMIESRLLAGDKKLFAAFRKEFESTCVRGKEKDYIAFRMENLKELRGRYGASVFMQEPNIKSGCGGLRDYQNLLWTGAFHSGATTTAKMVDQKILRDKERRLLEEAYDFLLRVRTEMHYQTGRASDQLTLQLQGKVATSLGYPEKSILRRCEAFMRDYYSHTRTVHLVTTLALARIREERGMKPGILAKFLGKRSEKSGAFVITNGEIYPTARDIFNKEPALMMRAFHLAQTRELGFSAELGDLVKRRLQLVDRTFRYDKEIRTVFLSILSAKGQVGRILRLMHDLGFLGKYLPEFEPLTCLVQHEFFHRYTADEHTLRCIEKIDELLFTENPKLKRYGEIFRHIGDAGVLYLAMLLHDTGKAANTKRHEEASALSAQRVARRLQLSPPRKKMLITLVSDHGEMSAMARTRNVEDPATVSEFAEVVRDADVLDALMVITLADGMGTSDEGWSDWKEQMVWRLYHQTKEYIADSEGFLAERAQRREELHGEVTRLLPAEFTEELEAHFAGMEERYFLSHDAHEIGRHIRLFRRFLSEGLGKEGPNLEAVVEWIDHAEAGHEGENEHPLPPHGVEDGVGGVEDGQLIEGHRSGPTGHQGGVHQVHRQKAARVVDDDGVHPVPGQSHWIWCGETKRTGAPHGLRSSVIVRAAGRWLPDGFKGTHSTGHACAGQGWGGGHKTKPCARHNGHRPPCVRCPSSVLSGRPGRWCVPPAPTCGSSPSPREYSCMASRGSWATAAAVASASPALSRWWPSGSPGP